MKKKVVYSYLFKGERRLEACLYSKGAQDDLVADFHKTPFTAKKHMLEDCEFHFEKPGKIIKITLEEVE